MKKRTPIYKKMVFPIKGKHKPASTWAGSLQRRDHMIKVLKSVLLSFHFLLEFSVCSGWHTQKVWSGCHHLLHGLAKSLLVPQSPYQRSGLLRAFLAPSRLEQNEALSSSPASDTQLIKHYTADHSAWLILGFVWELWFLPLCFYSLWLSVWPRAHSL